MAVTQIISIVLFPVLVICIITNEIFVKWANNFSGNSKIEIETTTLFTPYQNLTFYVILGFFLAGAT